MQEQTALANGRVLDGKLLPMSKACSPVVLGHLLLVAIWWAVLRCHVLQEQAALVDGRGWKASYFIPAGADRGVATFRRWLERAGGGGPAYGPYGTALTARL